MLISWNIALCHRERKHAKTDGAMSEMQGSQPHWSFTGWIQDNLNITYNNAINGL